MYIVICLYIIESCDYYYLRIWFFATLFYQLIYLLFLWSFILLMIVFIYIFVFLCYFILPIDIYYFLLSFILLIWLKLKFTWLALCTLSFSAFLTFIWCLCVPFLGYHPSPEYWHDIYIFVHFSHFFTSWHCTHLSLNAQARGRHITLHCPRGCNFTRASSIVTIIFIFTKRQGLMSSLSHIQPGT